MLVAAFLVLAAPGAAQATETSIAVVPARLPLSLRGPVARERDALERDVDSFNALVPDFLARCGPGKIPEEAAALLAACGGEFARLRARQDSITGAKAAFRARVDSADARFVGACPTLDAQLARDRDALRRQQAVNAATSAELEAWAEESADAQRSALTLGAKAILGEAATRLRAREANAVALRSALARHEGALRAGGVPPEEARELLDVAARLASRARMQAEMGVTLEAALDLDAWYGLVKVEAGAIAARMAESDTGLRVALRHPAFEWIAARDPSLSDLVRAPLDLAATTPGFERFAPHYALAAFVVDYGYEAARWAASAERILQGRALSDQALLAVESLTRQIRRTVEWRNACRSAGMPTGTT